MTAIKIPLDEAQELAWHAWLNVARRAKHASERFILFDPDEPRVPSGDPQGGQWTSGGGGGASASTADKPGDELDYLVPDPETRRKIREAQARADAIPRTDKIDTPERRALREAVANQIYGDGADIKGREAWIVTGVPASGKSFLSKPLLSEKGAMLIDSDEIKAKLPEYGNGVGAGAVHVESSEIIMPNVIERAIDNGDNIVMPRVGRNYDGLNADIAGLHGAGYKVHLLFVDVPDQVAVDRAVARFLKTGRLVNVAYVHSVDGHPRRAFQRAVKEGIADGYEMWDTNVPEGTPARRIM